MRLYTQQQLCAAMKISRVSFSRRVQMLTDEGKFQKKVPNTYGYTEEEVKQLSVLLGVNLLIQNNG